MSAYKTTPIVSPEMKIRAERYLLGAMLREPSNMAEQISRLNPVALSHAANGLAEVFAEVLRQFTATGTYNVVTIQAKVNFPELLHIAAESTEVDLSWAVENWWDEYTKWAELTAMSAAAAVNGDALTIRQKQEETRGLLGLHGDEVKTDSKDDFAKWGVDKLSGVEAVYKTAMPIQSVADSQTSCPLIKPSISSCVRKPIYVRLTHSGINLLKNVVDAANSL